MKSDAMQKETQTDTKEDVSGYLNNVRQLVDNELRKYLKDKADDRYIETLIGRAGFKYHPEAITKSILEPAWYLLNQGGKRWRPALTMLVIETYGKDPKDYMEFAIIPEVIHNSTLIKDDIEDQSDMRRNVPALHKAFGLDIATNTSDFMFYFPMKALVDTEKISTETKSRILFLYIKDMTRITFGQATDLAWHRGLVDASKITEDQYLEMAKDKTGVLSGFACGLGGILGGAEEETAKKLNDAGSLMGVAFQIQDDILNIVPSGVSESKGGVGDDISEGKITLMTIYAMHHAATKERERLVEILAMHTKDKERIDEAIEILQNCGSVGYAREIAEKMGQDAEELIKRVLLESPAKDKLLKVVDFLVTRNK